MKHAPHPPRFAVRLLSWYCKPTLLEDLQGDLEECFDRNVTAKGVARAKLIFIADVIKFCRPYTFRKIGLHNPFYQPMLSSYIKTSGRSLLRNKLFSTINIVGLAISLSVGLLMIGMLSDLYSYDKFNANYKQTYRINSLYTYMTNPDNHYYATTSLKAGLDILETFPTRKHVAIMRSNVGEEVKIGSKVVMLKGFSANENLLNVFTFPLRDGDKESVLKDPYTAVVTETAAKKLFGDADPIGKVFGLDDAKQYTVTGVLKDLPAFSHMRFDFLISLSSLEDVHPANVAKLVWDNMWDTQVFIVLPETTTPSDFQLTLDRLATEENKTIKNATVTLSLLPLKDIALGEQFNNSWWGVMPTSYVWILVILSAVVILSACFNYTNLSVARSLRRSREVGIRKVVGAGRKNVMLQFMTEAVVISMLALAFAFLLFILIRPAFLQVNETLAEMLRLELSPRVIAGFLALGLLTGISAGFFPAVFFTKINAVAVLKGNVSVKGFRQVNIRKALIVAQYALSLMLILATVFGYRQYQHFLKFDLGYTTENIVNIRLFDVKPDLLAHELELLPEVKGTSKSEMITSVGNYHGGMFKNIETQDSTGVFFNTVDEKYLPLHDHKLLAGRNFNAKTSEGVNDEIIVDQTTLKHFNIANQDPQKALGTIVMVNNRHAVIVGVMKNYYYGRSDGGGDQRVIFRYTNSTARYINAKIISSDWPETREKLEKIWKKYDEVHPLQAEFYNDRIAKTHGEMASMLKIVGVLSFLAITIASLGMLGMIVLTTETRLKEISIRKVLGASEGNLIFTISKGFLLLLVVSAAIGLPAATYFFQKVILEYRANKAPLHPQDFIAVFGGVIILALVMIVTQTLKAARENPSNVLKNE